MKESGREGDRPSEGEPCSHLRCNRRLIPISYDRVRVHWLTLLSTVSIHLCILLLFCRYLFYRSDPPIHVIISVLSRPSSAFYFPDRRRGRLSSLPFLFLPPSLHSSTCCFVLLFVMRSVRFDSASAGSGGDAMSSNTPVLSNPAAEVAAQTAALAAGRNRPTSIPSDTANAARSIAGSKVLDCFSADGKQADFPNSCSGTSSDTGAVGTSIDEPVKTVIRNVIIPRSDPSNPASSFKLDVRCLLQLFFVKVMAEDKKTGSILHTSYLLSLSLNPTLCLLSLSSLRIIDLFACIDKIHTYM